MRDKLLVVALLQAVMCQGNVYADSEIYGKKSNQKSVRSVMPQKLAVLDESSLNDIKSLIKSTLRKVVEGDAEKLAQYIVRAPALSHTVVTEKYTELERDSLINFTELQENFLINWQDNFSESFYDSLNEYEVRINIVEGAKAQFVSSKGVTDIPLVKVPGTLNNAYYLRTTKSEIELNKSVAELPKVFSGLNTTTYTKTKLIEAAIEQTINSVS